MMFELIPYTKRRNVNLYNPFEELEDLQRKFYGETTIAEFKTDIRDEGESYVLEADLPGFDKKDISVDIEGDMLTIRAERKSRSEEKDSKKGYVRRERCFGSFSRSFEFDGVRMDAITAAYKDGVLELTMPKKQETLPTSRKLEIQ